MQRIMEGEFGMWPGSSVPVSECEIRAFELVGHLFGKPQTPQLRDKYADACDVVCHVTDRFVWDGKVQNQEESSSPEEYYCPSESEEVVCRYDSDGECSRW
jgi:hypothetical protein